MLLIYYNFVVIICRRLWMTLVSERCCCKIFIGTRVSKNLSNNLRILLIKRGWIKYLSLSLGHFLTIINIIMRNLMGGLRSSMSWSLLTFVRSNSILYRHIMHSIADKHWPLRVARNFLDVSAVRFQELRSVLTVHADRFLVPNSHCVVLWGLLRRRQIPFPLGQFRGLGPLVIEHVVRNLRTNLRTFFAGVNSLILSNSLTLRSNTMILLVKVYVLLSLVLETIG